MIGAELPGNALDEAARPPAPVRLRQVDAGLARLGTLIGQGRWAPIVVDGIPVRLSVSRATQVEWPPSPDALAFDAHVGPIVLAPAREVMRVLTGIDLPPPVQEQGLPEPDPLQRLALELAAQALPAAWFELLGAENFLSHESPMCGYQVTLSLSQPGARWSVAAHLQGSADALADVLGRAGWRRSQMELSALPPGWALRFPLSMGRTVLSTAALQTLAAGDIVIVDQPGFGADGLGPINLGGRAAICRLQWGNPSALEVTEWHSTTNASTMNTHPQTAPAIEDENDASDTADASVDSVPITLSFDLGMVELTLAELKALAPGSVVPIAGALPPQVNLRAGGRRIGTGELIEVDGRLAVEVRRLGAVP